MRFVDFFYHFQHPHTVSILLCCLDKSLYVFGEAGTSVSASRIKELASDTAVGTDTATYHVYIGSYQFTQIGNVVHKTDTGSKHGIGCVFGHLGRWDVHKDYAEIV